MLLIGMLCSLQSYGQGPLPIRDSLNIEDYFIEYHFVEGGSFVMGSDTLSEEKPAHKVTVGSFYISKYEISQRIWAIVMGYNESYHKKCDDCPVEYVSWDEVQEFISKVSKAAGKRYRLPTEAEWEFAARGGMYSKNYTYSGSNYADSVGWNFGNSNHMTHLVGQKKPNELGLYDMSGNVEEWCNDWWDYDYYSRSPTNNPKGPISGTRKVARGGCYGVVSDGLRIKGRAFHGSYPSETVRYIGFRLARDVQ